jgi:hypothetical protein
MILDLLSLQSDKSKITRDKHEAPRTAGCGWGATRGVLTRGRGEGLRAREPGGAVRGCARGNPEAR